MKKRSYKALYLNEVYIAQTYENVLDEILWFLEEIKINVADYTRKSSNHLGYERVIALSKNGKEFNVVISHILEEENKRHLENTKGNK